MTYLVIITVGYVIFVLLRVVYVGDIYSAFTFFLSPGPFRVVFLTVDKIIDTLFYLFVRKSLSKISMSISSTSGKQATVEVEV